MNDFRPPNYYESLYRKPVQNKDSYGNDVITYKEESPNRIDVVNDNLIYIGWSEYGMDENTNNWKIKKIELIGNVWSFTYADGNTLFDNNWTNRNILTYK